MIARSGHYECVAREGFVFIVPAGVVSALFWWYGYSWASLFFVLFTIALALFFRNPERTPPEGEHLLLSPADGLVVEIIDDAESEELDVGPLKRISIFMSIFNCHVNRWPISGTVRKITHVPGRFLDAREPASSTLNEHNSLIVDADGVAIEVVQIAGKVARRIACWVTEGDEIQRGDRFGLIRFGSRLDVYMPKDFQAEVAIGQRVKAGVSVIARAPDATSGLSSSDPTS
jgi:phosphatidylserine decarboxylase